MPHGTFKVLHLLPCAADGVPLYHVKGEVEGIERIVRQYEIKAASR
jgi:hypothetical protein